MMTIYHYQKCSKSRGALCILEDKKAKFNIRYYLQEPLSMAELKKLQDKLGVSVHEMVRKDDPMYKELISGKNPSELELLSILEKHPILLQRPIVEQGDRAIIARPPESIFDFMDESKSLVPNS